MHGTKRPFPLREIWGCGEKHQPGGEVAAEGGGETPPMQVSARKKIGSECDE